MRPFGMSGGQAIHPSIELILKEKWAVLLKQAMEGFPSQNLELVD